MKILITGSLGLVGSEATRFFLDQGHQIVGVDNNMRQYFFGRGASVMKNMIRHDDYTHLNTDIMNLDPVLALYKPDAVIHCAAQPSHDWSAYDPITDFRTNAEATLRLLESARQHCPKAVFIFVSTNKVYGDRPNTLSLVEMDTRYEGPMEGIDETMSVDTCMHSPFGVGKLAGDVYAQEYARYYGMKTGIFRCGCITGSRHSGAPLHGFLSFMARCKKDKVCYKINGYKGKQVRDNIHAYDLVSAFNQFILNPRPGEVYNMGGGRHSNISVLEALERMEVESEYFDEPRKGDHIWYISDVRKFQAHYPEWDYKYDMEKIIEDLISA